MNRRGFFGTLAAVALLPFAKLRKKCQHNDFDYMARVCRDCGETELNVLIEAYRSRCDHYKDKWTCDPKGGLEPPVMRCLCGIEMPIKHVDIRAYQQRAAWMAGNLDLLGILKS